MLEASASTEKESVSQEGLSGTEVMTVLLGIFYYYNFCVTSLFFPFCVGEYYFLWPIP